MGVFGEHIVVMRDDDVIIPKGTLSGVPRFTMDELLRMRLFIGMKGVGVEEARGVWLLKKYLGVTVVQ